MIYYKRLAGLSLLLQGSSESIRLHLESPKGGGRAEEKQCCTQFSFKKRRSCAEGEGRRRRRLQPLPRKTQGRKRPQPPSPTVKLQPGRGPPRTRVYWIAPCPAQGLPETPASGCPKKPRIRSRESAAVPTRNPGPSVQNFISAPRAPSGKGKPRWAGEDANWLQFVTSHCCEYRRGGRTLGVTSPGFPSGGQNPPCNSSPAPKASRAAPSPPDTVAECKR